ncbi:succinate dehydrogenase assembly factor 2 [Thiomicrospira microaerophila]|uniref:succinate dehydrogenase assembly factor 2 n=1 Tax=Thiomicrospira microaerophila TaxID=406020 RepID=UPI0005C891A3|nr:succinate dehydrogenase assembly factor 2 [Thiomicrospira microaerophila]
MINNKIKLIKKLKLAARRGNLETDLLLNRFIDQYLAHETHPALWSDFEQLLELDEQSLLTYLLDPAQADSKHQGLLKLIRKNYLISTD